MALGDRAALWLVEAVSPGASRINVRMAEAQHAASRRARTSAPNDAVEVSDEDAERHDGRVLGDRIEAGRVGDLQAAEPDVGSQGGP